VHGHSVVALNVYRSCELIFDDAPHDLEPQSRVGVKIELLGKPAPIVLDLDDNLATAFCETDRDARIHGVG